MSEPDRHGQHSPFAAQAHDLIPADSFAMPWPLAAQPVTHGLSIGQCRAEGLKLAVQLLAREDTSAYDAAARDRFAERVIATAGRFSGWLLARPARITVGRPTISEQADPARTFPSGTGEDMAVTITDTQIATYPAPEALDSKGFEVADTITASESSGGTVVAMTANADGTTSFAAVAPGAAQVTWTDGTLSFSDTINVTAGDAATIVVGAPVITDEAPAPSGA